MKRIALVLGLGVTLLFAARAEAAGDDPAQVTRRAYQTAMSHFGFSLDSIKVEKAFFTPGLYAAMLKKANAPVPKGDAPDIEGDLLLDCQDVPTKLHVGDATLTGDQARVPVTLAWDAEKRQYTVLLKRLDGAWKIDNVDYGKDGKDGKLTDQLK